MHKVSNSCAQPKKQIERNGLINNIPIRFRIGAFYMKSKWEHCHCSISHLSAAKCVHVNCELYRFIETNRYVDLNCN